MLQLTLSQVFLKSFSSLYQYNLLHIWRVYCRHQGQHLMQQKMTLLALHWPGRLLLLPLLRQDFWLYFRYFIIYFTQFINLANIGENFENNRKNTSENFVKLSLKQNFKSQLCFHLVNICVAEIDFSQHCDKPAK